MERSDPTQESRLQLTGSQPLAAPLDSCGVADGRSPPDSNGEALQFVAGGGADTRPPSLGLRPGAGDAAIRIQPHVGWTSSRVWNATVRAALAERRRRLRSESHDCNAEVERDAGVSRLSRLRHAGWFYATSAIVTSGTFLVDIALWSLHVTIGRIAMMRRIARFVVEAFEVLGYVIEDAKNGVRKVIVGFNTVVAMNICAYSLWWWSEREEMRFPVRQPALQLLVFPFVGPCAEMEYWLLCINTIAIVGGLTFAVSIGIVKQAE